MVAVGATVMLAVSAVALTNVVELTVIPAPNPTAEVGSKPVPVIVTFWLVAPWPSALGLSVAIVGALLTVNAPVAAALLPSPLVSVTSWAPVLEVPDTVMFAVTCVALTYVTEFVVMPEPNDAARAGPLSKPVPVIVTFWFEAP